MAQGFKAAFAAARKAGKKEFTWNGKNYNTKVKEEVSAAPAKSKMPAKRPVAAIAKEKVSSGRGAVQAVAPSKPAKKVVPSVAPKTSSKPVQNPRNAPGFIEKLRMGSAARTEANARAAEALKRKKLKEGGT